MKEFYTQHQSSIKYIITQQFNFISKQQGPARYQLDFHHHWYSLPSQHYQII